MHIIPTPASPEIPGMDSGVYDLDQLEQSANEKKPQLVGGLFQDPSISLVAGNSGLGKTPYVVQCGLCIAEGIPFLSHQIPEPRSVLYAGSEIGQGEMKNLVGSLLKHVKLSKRPRKFRVFNPFWRSTPEPSAKSLGRQVLDVVAKLRPNVVIVDPLRSFFPSAIDKQSATVAMLREMRELKCSWILVHHLRKMDNGLAMRPSLDDDPHGWFQEVAGSFALINGTDTRLGIEPCFSDPDGDLTAPSDTTCSVHSLLDHGGPSGPIQAVQSGPVRGWTD